MNKDDYSVMGIFYERGGLKFRSCLSIMKKCSEANDSDLMVVMMNPGSSYPLNGQDDGRGEFTATQPDNTQYQIMKVMERCGFEWARVFNLSDLRTPDSSKLFTMLKKGELDGVDHSIFCEARANEFEQLYCHDVPVIYGWGVNKVLEPLALAAMAKTDRYKVAGLKKEGEEAVFYHPLPRVYARQGEWVDAVASQLGG
jgi:hypothetical protein